MKLLQPQGIARHIRSRSGVLASKRRIPHNHVKTRTAFPLNLPPQVALPGTKILKLGSNRLPPLSVNIKTPEFGSQRCSLMPANHVSTIIEADNTYRVS